MAKTNGNGEKVKSRTKALQLVERDKSVVRFSMIASVSARAPQQSKYVNQAIKIHASPAPSPSSTHPTERQVTDRELIKKAPLIAAYRTIGGIRKAHLAH